MGYRLLLLFFLSQSCSIYGQDEAAFAVDKLSSDLISKAYAVIRSDITSVTLHSSNKYISQREQVITVMSKKGGDFGNFRISYKEGTSSIKNIKISIYDAAGRHVRSIKSKEIEDYAVHDGMSMISDVRMKVYDVQPIAYPFTIAMSWKEESSNTLSLPTWYPILSTNVSVEHSSYQVMNNSDIKIRIGERNLNYFNIEKEGEWKYMLNNQPVIHRESYTPSVFEKYPMVYFAPVDFSYEGYTGSYQSWNEFGQWIYSSLLSDKADLDSRSARAELDPILSGITDKREIIKIIYDYVQENTRYILIGLDEGGLVPLSAQKVHDVKYGDCKALSFYMKSLLNVYGIEANYVIVRAGAGMPEDIFIDYPHVAPANHVIINAPLDHDTIWLDCTSHYNPFDFLGDFTDDRLALQVGKDGGSLVRTPVYKKDQNKTVVNATLKLNKEGDITTALNVHEYGLKIDKVVYLQSLNPKEYDEYLHKDLLRKFDNVVLTDRDVSLNEEEVVGFESYQFSAKKYVQVASDYMILESALLPFDIPRLKKDSNRENDILFPRECQAESEVIYHLPDGYRVSIIAPITIESDFGKYEQKLESVDHRTFKINRLFTLYKGRYESDRYKEVKYFFDKIRKSENQKISISNKS